MMRREYMATEYTFYRFPNMHAIMLIPLLPAIITVVLRSNLYAISGGAFETANAISKAVILDYLFYFKLVLSVVSAFFLVYRWSLIKQDGSFGYWVTQGVNRYRFIVFTVLSYGLLISVSEALGLISLMVYLGILLPFWQLIGLVAAMLLSNILLSLVAVTIADLVEKPEIAGLLFITVIALNYTINTDTSSILYKVFQLESNYDVSGFSLAMVFELILIAILGSVLFYVQSYKDIEI